MKHYKSFLTQFKQQAVYIVFFAAMFSIIGYLVPRIYLQYFDRTIYYSLELPVKMDKEIYKPCDFVKASAFRKSFVNTMGASVRELVLISEDRKVYETIVDIAITQGEKLVTVTWQLPCNLEEGQYYWKGGIQYEIQGIYKYFSFYTEPFLVE